MTRLAQRLRRQQEVQWKAKKGWWLAPLLGPVGLGEKKKPKKKKNTNQKPNRAFFSTVRPGGVTGYVWLRAPSAWECGTGSDGAHTGTEKQRERTE